ncbi:C-type lectin domain family 4 member M-like isoform X1 [Ostrea edulis]|uniref:C-type lectin domain family 4 member M-like isoform X1 n=1 Tax=Ostrea edulis TaxID=37623 RepID=UPI002095AE69|nr:C-type lectin domain family 4 member M-like isoform X1 [Ostrea edulis]
MKWSFVSVSCLLAIVRFVSSQTLYSNSKNNIVMHLPMDVNREVRNVFFPAFENLKKDLNRELQVQNSRWTSYIKQTRTLVDVLDQQQQTLRTSVSELSNLRVHDQRRLEAMVNAKEEMFQRQLGNVSNALHKEIQDFTNIVERLSIIDEKFLNQSVTDREIRKKLADLFNTQRSLLNNTSHLFTRMKVINDMYLDIEQNFTSKLTLTTFQLTQSLVEVMENKTKECKRNISTGVLSSLRNQSEEMGMTKEIIFEIKDTSSEQASCPPDWTSFGHSCYMAIEQKKSWDSAAMKCIRYGSKLVEIETKDENDFLKNTLLKNKDNYWTGGIDDVTEGKWFWAVSGSPLNFTDWNTGEPNNALKNEDCLEFSKHTGRKKAWNDNRCDKTMKFVCEKSVK